MERANIYLPRDIVVNVDDTCNALTQLLTAKIACTSNIRSTSFDNSSIPTNAQPQISQHTERDRTEEAK